MNIKRKLRKLRWKILGNPKLTSKKYPTYWFQKVLVDPQVQIIQIGSNDGRSGDPLYHLLHKKQSWSGLFVEPVTYIFQKLKKNYPDSVRFRFENAAINQGEVLDFYWVDPIAKEKISDLPFYFDQLGSFDKNHIIKALDGKLEPYIISEKINGITFNDLLDKHKISDFDILHIDVEGYDWNVLSQLNQEKYQPMFILYEGVHLSKNDLEASYEFLKANYHLFKHEGDILAVNKRVEQRHLKGMKRGLAAFDIKKYK